MTFLNFVGSPIGDLYKIGQQRDPESQLQNEFAVLDHLGSQGSEGKFL